MVKRTAYRQVVSAPLVGVTAALAALSGSQGVYAQDTPPAPSPTPAPTPSNSPTTPTTSQTPTVVPAFTMGQRYDAWGRPIPDPKAKNGKKGTGDKADGSTDTQKLPDRRKGTAERLFGPLFRDITMTGGFSTRFQQNAVNGTADGSQRFSDQNLNNPDYRNVGPFQNNVDMTVQGRIFNAFNVNARLTNSRYGNFYNQVFAFDYHNRDNSTRLNLGNVNASLLGNQFATFTRSVQGIRFERIGKWGGGGASAPLIDTKNTAPDGKSPKTALSGENSLDKATSPDADFLPPAPVVTYPGVSNPTNARQAFPFNSNPNNYGSNTYSAGNRQTVGVNGTTSNGGLMGMGQEPSFRDSFVSGQRSWRIKTQGIASMTRASTRRGSFRGAGTSGPYFLNASSLLEHSERIQLNGQELVADQDYKVDYFVGQITFLNGRIINAEDTVTFTYESQNYNNSPGILTGTRFDVMDPKGNAYGVTYVQQKATGQRVRNGNLTERFPVYADSSYKYALSSVIDTAFPVEIRWYNRVLVEGVDYILNRDLRYFQLITTALPPDSSTTYTGTLSLSVTYRPVRQASLAGDRSVLGVDSTLRLAPHATVAFDVGRSEGETAQQAGQAVSVRTTLTGGGKNNQNAWQWTTGVKDVGQTFSTVDSTSGAFLQPERNFNTGIRFAPNKVFNFSTSLTQGTVGNRSYGTTSTANSNTVQWANNRSWDFRASMLRPGAPTLNFLHQQTTQSGGTSKNVLANTSLDSSWAASSQLQFSAGLSRTETKGRSIYATAYNNSVTSSGTTGSTIIDQYQDSSGAGVITNSTADNSRFAATFVPKSWLTFAGNLGFSRSRSASGAYNSRSTGLSVTASPSTVLQFNAGVTDSANGQSTASYYNPGTSGGSTIIPTNSTGQRTRVTNFGMTYAPSTRLSGQFNVNRTLSLVPGYDNTQSGGFDWSISTSPRERWQFGLSGSQQDVTYVGGQGDSKNKMLSLNALVGPFGRFRIDGSLSRSNFGSASYFSTSSTPTSSSGNTSGYFQQGSNTTLSFNTEYALGSRYSLVGRWQGIDQSAPSSSSTGGSTGTRAGTNFWQGNGSIGFDVRLTEIMGFQVNFNSINLHDREDSRYSYRARMLTADLSARF